MYGTQTTESEGTQHDAFENDVKMYGTQTSMSWGEEQKSLRMM